MNHICIVAPHQDDEIIACTYLMQRALRDGSKITVVFLTTGDFKGRTMARIRLLESMSAVKALGIPEENIVTFGYANTGMKRSKSLLYKFYTNPQKQKRFHTSYASETYHPNSGETFHFMRYRTEAAYTAENFETDIRNFMQIFQPDMIYVTSGYDKHGDHRAAYFILRDVLINLKKDYGYAPELYTFLIHTAGVWPKKTGMRFSRPWLIPKKLWKQKITICARPEDIRMKRSLIQGFESQKECMHFLLSFAKQEEIFWRQSLNE